MSKRPSPRNNEDELPGALSVSSAKKKARIEFNIIPKSPNWILTFTDLDKTGLVDGDQNNGYYLAIEPGEKWEITFTLAKMWNWMFDKDPITFKSTKDAENYKITSQSPAKLVIEAYSPLSSGLQEPWPEHNQPFNLYVVIEQSNKKSYPLTIDPDVKNPPLGGNRMSEPSNLPVPLA